MVRKVEELDWKKEGPPRDGSSGFTEKSGGEGGHDCMGQCGRPTCGDSGRNALLEDKFFFFLVPVWLRLVPGC